MRPAANLSVELKAVALLAATASILPVPALAQDDGAAGAVGEEPQGEVIRIPREAAPGGPSLLGDDPAELPGLDALPDRAASSEPPDVLVILAHPDDEILVAPALSRIAREGGNVTLVYATSGDAGPGVSDMQPGEELATLREDEARCAAFALRIDEPIFWKLGDGTLSTMARAPDSAARELIARTTDLIAIQQPDIVITWGPDGGYGHADHRMVSNVVTQVVQSMGAGRPTLLYPAIPASSEDPPRGFEEWARTDVSLITDRIRYEGFDIDATRNALDCHISQFDEQFRQFVPSLLHREVWQGQVHFRLALPDPNAG